MNLAHGRDFLMRRITIVFYNTLKTLTLPKLFRLLRLGVVHPLFTLLCFYATARTFTIALRYFPKTNSTDGIGNAFRHALWTCIMMMYCCKISSPAKALSYCKNLTDLYEELFPNEPAQTRMDLHNNAVGLAIFMGMLETTHRQFFETSFFIDVLLQKVKTAEILNETENSADELVFIDNG